VSLFISETDASQKTDSPHFLMRMTRSISCDSRTAWDQRPRYVTAGAYPRLITCISVSC